MAVQEIKVKSKAAFSTSLTEPRLLPRGKVSERCFPATVQGSATLPRRAARPGRVEHSHPALQGIADELRTVSMILPQV